MADKPLLTVCLLTYNHAPYIAQAIEGVLKQKTNFEWSLIITDDCSNDGTIEILKKYKEDHPNLITLILNEKNLGPYQSWVNLLTTPISKYFAYFEGDDYWIDTEKLQKQTDFLEANPDYAYTGHHVKALIQETGELIDYGTFSKNPIELKDTVFGPPIHTCSLVARNGLGIPKGIKNLFAGDDALICHFTSQGLGYTFTDFMGVYRMSSAGTWSTLSHNEKKFREFVIHLWIFRRYKPVLTTQSLQIAREFKSVAKNKISDLKRVSLKYWPVLLLALIISIYIKNKHKLSIWLKK